MIELPAERVGPYVRALRAALAALAPGEDHVPLSAALDHLDALDPEHGGAILGPAEVARASGMPMYTWLERARSEAELARTDPYEPTDDELQRALALDRDLGRRMTDRRALHQRLRHAELLASTSLGGAVRWVGAGEAHVALAYDRLAPDGRWMRIRLELRVPEPRTEAISVVDGRVRLDDRVRHLLTRHSGTPLTPLRLQIEGATEARVSRISRSWLGPFWFPGVLLPDGVPADLGRGLLFHASTEVADQTLRQSRHQDPFEPAPDARAPSGWHEYRERRFAASGPVYESLLDYVSARGIRPLVVPIVGPPR